MRLASGCRPKLHLRPAEDLKNMHLASHGQPKLHLRLAQDLKHVLGGLLRTSNCYLIHTEDLTFLSDPY